MANVTNWAFRQIIAKCGRPDIFYTEFLSCDGIVHDRKKMARELYFEAPERPIVVQFFGAKPENFYKCAQLAQELGFDGIDINMGCPDKSVEKQGGGAALIKNSKLAQEIIKATKDGAHSTSSKPALPVSVKTRLGYNKVEIETWIPQILDMNIAALTIHGRTRKEMSKVFANWELIARVGDINRQMKKETLIIGNGDVKNLSDAYQKAKDYRVDGIMVGRGIFNNPWFFADKTVSFPSERLDLLLEHMANFQKLWGDGKNFDTLKKFFKIYINGWPRAKELRIKLMNCKNSEEAVKTALKDYTQTRTTHP